MISVNELKSDLAQLNSTRASVIEQVQVLGKVRESAQQNAAEAKALRKVYRAISDDAVATAKGQSNGAKMREFVMALLDPALSAYPLPPSVINTAGDSAWNDPQVQSTVRARTESLIEDVDDDEVSEQYANGVSGPAPDYPTIPVNAYDLYKDAVLIGDINNPPNPYDGKVYYGYFSALTAREAAREQLALDIADAALKQINSTAPQLLEIDKQIDILEAAIANAEAPPVVLINQLDPEVATVIENIDKLGDDFFSDDGSDTGDDGSDTGDDVNFDPDTGGDDTVPPPPPPPPPPDGDDKGSSILPWLGAAALAWAVLRG